MIQVSLPDRTSFPPPRLYQSRILFYSDQVEQCVPSLGGCRCLPAPAEDVSLPTDPHGSTLHLLIGRFRDSFRVGNI